MVGRVDAASPAKSVLPCSAQTQTDHPWGRQKSQLHSELFDGYIGTDDSGAETANPSLKGLRVYEADRTNEATEIEPLGCQGVHWTRRAIAAWLVGRLTEITVIVVRSITRSLSRPVQKT
jgi:hypothetical protein